MQITNEHNELKQYFQEKCEKAYLTPEQAAQVIDFRMDPWWCNDDRQADVIIDFFKRQNERICLRQPCGDESCPTCATAPSGLLEEYLGVVQR